MKRKKKTSTKFMDMKHLEVSYDGLINETASREDLIKLLKIYQKQFCRSQRRGYYLQQGRGN